MKHRREVDTQGCVQFFGRDMLDQSRRARDAGVVDQDVEPAQLTDSGIDECLALGGFAGIGVPRNTPADIITLLNKELNAGLADATLKKRFADLGSVAFPGSPVDFGKLVADETEKWAKVIKFANIKPE